MEKIPELPKSTLNGWLKNIELTREQKDRLLTKIKSAGEKARLLGAFTNHKKRLDLTKMIIDSAKQESGDFLKDPLFINFRGLKIRGFLLQVYKLSRKPKLHLGYPSLFSLKFPFSLTPF